MASQVPQVSQGPSNDVPEGNPRSSTMLLSKHKGNTNAADAGRNTGNAQRSILGTEGRYTMYQFLSPPYFPQHSPIMQILSNMFPVCTDRGKTVRGFPGIGSGTAAAGQMPAME